jgi:hypothetical protein
MSQILGSSQKEYSRVGFKKNLEIPYSQAMSEFIDLHE